MNMIHKKLLIPIIFIIVSIFLLAFFSLKQKDDSSLKIGLNAGSLSGGPVIIAQNKDIFEKHGISIELVPLPSGKEVSQALALSQVDIGLAGISDIILPIDKGVPIKIIAPLELSSTFVLIRRGEMNSLKELIGKTVAARWGSGTSVRLYNALEKEGIDPQSVTFVDIKKEFRPIALLEKNIVDAVVEDSFKLKEYQNMGAEILPEWEDKFIYDVFPSEVIAVNVDFIKENEEKINLFFDALAESLQFMKNNEIESAQILSKYLDDQTEGALNVTPEAIVDDWHIRPRFLLWHNTQIFLDRVKIMKKMNVIENNLSLEDIYDAQFQAKLEFLQSNI